jgi:hypothetical protein
VTVQHALHAFRRRDQAKEPNAAGAGRLECRDCRGRGAPGGEHGIEYKVVPLALIGGELCVVADRLERILLAI